jgi:hypothetical protein
MSTNGCCRGLPARVCAARPYGCADEPPTPSESYDLAANEDALIRLIAACAECDCDFNCYCIKNMEWAERRLEELRDRHDAR